jgi:hypothetical protein
LDSQAVQDQHQTICMVEAVEGLVPQAKVQIQWVEAATVE